MQFSGNTVVNLVPIENRSHSLTAMLETPCHSQVADIQRMAGRYGASSHYGSPTTGTPVFSAGKVNSGWHGRYYAAACAGKEDAAPSKHLDGPL